MPASIVLSKLVLLWILLLIGVTAVLAFLTQIVIWYSGAERVVVRLANVSFLGYLTVCCAVFLLCLFSGIAYVVPTTFSTPILTLQFSRLFVLVFVLTVGPWFVSCSVVFLVTHAAIQQVRDADEPLRSAIRRFSVSYAVKFGVPLLLWSLVEILPAGPLAGIAVGVVYFAMGAMDPFIIELMHETQKLNPAECERIGVQESEFPISVIDTDRTKISHGLAAGLLPGSQRIYLTSYMLSELSPESVAAVVEHERAHHRRHHLRLRMVFKSGALAVAVGVLTVNSGYWLHCLVLAVPVWLCFCAMCRRFEHDADRDAGQAISGSAMSNALVETTKLNFAPRNENRLNELFSGHPSLSRRLKRIRLTTALKSN